MVEPRWKTPRVRMNARAVKRALLERSGGRCEAAFSLMCTGVGVHAHHVKRASQGGSDDPSNRVWCCHPCHALIHAEPQSARDRGLLAPKGDQ